MIPLSNEDRSEWYQRFFDGGCWRMLSKEGKQEAIKKLKRIYKVFRKNFIEGMEVEVNLPINPHCYHRSLTDPEIVAREEAEYWETGKSKYPTATFVNQDPPPLSELLWPFEGRHP